MPLESEIIVVSGLPRSGTSLMMQMLARGGIGILTDGVRMPDVDNPHGYYEFEPAKAIQRDASWVPMARGKAIKLVSLLLRHLPPGEMYRVIFLERDLDEVLTSQERMLWRSGQRAAAPRDELRRSFELHLSGLQRWIAGRDEMRVLRVPYQQLLDNPLEQSERVNGFLDGVPNAARMAEAVDTTLYRNRSQTCDD